MDHRSLADCLTPARSAASGPALSLDVEDGVARLTMGRGDGNALGVEELRALVALIEQAERSEARAIVLRSVARKSFCSGADLDTLAMLHANPVARVPFRNAMRGALSAIRMTPAPVIAAVGGDCFGLGLALATASDIRIAAAGARFAVDSARLGIGYPLEDIVRLRALVGEGQAARLLFAAEAIDAKEASRIGLVESVAADAHAAAEALARSIAANAPAIVASLKHGLELAGMGRTSDEGHDRGFDAALGEDACAEGIAAARSGRSPDFRR